MVRLHDNKLQKTAPIRVLQRIINKSSLFVKDGLYYRYIYNKPLNEVKSDCLVFITGGDMLCYGNNEVIYINNYLYKRKIRTILWGCSVGKENLTPEKIETLKKFALITARESITKKVLDDLGLDNVSIYPDPAFVLNPSRIDLPKAFISQDVVGINLSNFVGADVGFESMFGKNLIRLMEKILAETNMTIMLIPHVFWQGQDDRIICNSIFERYRDNARVDILDSEKLNYCQIRYVISQCRFFVGARTHAIISAYSMCVPSLALGYSVKSRGIAKDIGMPEVLVMDYRELKEENALWKSFEYLMEHENEIRTHLQKTMPSYRKCAYDAEKVVEALRENSI